MSALRELTLFISQTRTRKQTLKSNFQSRRFSICLRRSTEQLSKPSVCKGVVYSGFMSTSPKSRSIDALEDMDSCLRAGGQWVREIRATGTSAGLCDRQWCKCRRLRFPYSSCKCTGTVFESEFVLVCSSSTHTELPCYSRTLCTQAFRWQYRQV